MKGKRNQLLPILRSSLPPLDKMIPYLETIEPNRCHSNFGILFRQFEERMADFFKVPIHNVAIVCNGTLALTAALLAYPVPRNTYCLMPSWTFSATPAAAALAGLNPFFLDVDLISQQLTPEHVLEFLDSGQLAKQEMGAVIVVSPFGAPVDREQWDVFTQQTHIPVIIDAAASFDAVHRIPGMQAGSTPSMISLHATKLFGIGEGGMLLSTDEELIKKVRGISNFGFDISRVASYLGMNAKMSEYAAAVGLAVLDSWNEIRERRLAVTKNYINAFDQLGIKHWLSTTTLTSTCNVLLPGKARKVRDYLLAHNIESRIWWANGCHTYPAYSLMQHESNLSNTEFLGNCMLGLPCSIDTSEEDIEDICAMIKDCLEPLADALVTPEPEKLVNA